MVHNNEKDIHELCVAFRKLGNQEFQVFEYIYSDWQKRCFMSYSEIGKTVSVSPSAARKAALKLMEYGVVGKYKDDFSGREVLFIRGDWMENLAKNTKSIPNPHEGIKRPRKDKRGEE